MKQQLWAIMAAGLGLAAVPGAHAQGFTGFVSGDLVVSSSIYEDTGAASQLMPGQTLPGGGTAVSGGAYPTVFENNTVDGSFGVTSPIYLNQFSISQSAGSLSLTPAGVLDVPTSDIVTSFSSKSELALNLSTDGTALTFMGYQAPVGALDVSNSNTPGAIDPTNPVTTTATYREVAQVGADGGVQVTATNAYSGNNGRAAILDSAAGEYLTVGNAGNGGNPQPSGIVNGAGVQSVTPGQDATPTSATNKVGSFSVTQTNPLTGTAYSAKPDKLGKDDNFRGETVFDNTLYITKGSGGNGIDTVYQVGALGTLPTGTNSPIAVLPGFNANLAKTNANSAPPNFAPFGLFFANADTLYVADEGDGTAADIGTAADPGAGLEKYSLKNGLWKEDYTLNAGLGLGQKYSIAGLDPSLDPATDGLRNITGKVNADGTVTIYGITSTVSASGDQGADPNELVAINDTLADTTLPTTESFQTLETAGYGQVLRGVSFAPRAAAVPESSSFLLLGLGLTPLAFLVRRRSAV